MNKRLIFLSVLIFSLGFEASACDSHQTGLQLMKTCEGNAEGRNSWKPEVQINLCASQLLMYFAGVSDESKRQGKPRASCRALYTKNKSNFIVVIPDDFVKFMKTRKDLWKQKAPAALDAYFFCK